MRRDLGIIDEFRQKARTYTAGETIFMLDGSAEFKDERLAGIICIERIKGKIGSKTETFVWGNDNGSVMITWGREQVTQLDNLENHMLLPTLSEIQMMMDIGIHKPPLHIIVAGADQFWDNEKELAACFRKLLREPGVLVDVILMPGKDKKLEQMILQLKEEKEIDRTEEPLRLTCITDAARFADTMVDAVNARLFYDSEEANRAAQQFLDGSGGQFSALKRLTLKGSTKV